MADPITKYYVLDGGQRMDRAAFAFWLLQVETVLEMPKYLQKLNAAGDDRSVLFVQRSEQRLFVSDGALRVLRLEGMDLQPSGEVPAGLLPPATLVVGQQQLDLPPDPLR